MSSSLTPTTTMLCASCATVEASAPLLQPEARARARARRGRCRGAARPRRSSQVALGVGEHPPAIDARLLDERLGDDLAGDDPDHARLPVALPRDREVVRRRAGRMRTVCLTHSGTSGRSISPTGAARLQHRAPARSARGRAGRARRPGSRARARPGARSPCQVAGLSVAITSASSGAMPAATASRTIELTWPSSAMCSGSRSSVQKAIRCGPNSRDERQQRRGGCARRTPRGSAATCRRAAARAPPRSCTPRGRSGCRPRRRRSAPCRARAARGRRRASRPASASFASSDSLAGDDAGEVHHLGEPEHPPAAEQPLEVAGREAAGAATRTPRPARTTRP